MKYKKLTLSVVISVIIISIVTLATIRIYYLNNRFPNPNIIKHSVNEVINGGDTSICILSSKMITPRF